jgi:hypothetical protein
MISARRLFNLTRALRAAMIFYHPQLIGYSGRRQMPMPWLEDGPGAMYKI